MNGNCALTTTGCWGRILELRADVDVDLQSGLSQAGGITAQGNGIDIGGAMIAVTIGITVGLFMSQALVYMFGSRKNAAMFSF